MTQAYINELAYEIVGCAIEVHKELEPGLLESIYEFAMEEELTSNGLEVKGRLLSLLFTKEKFLLTL